MQPNEGMKLTKGRACFPPLEYVPARCDSRASVSGPSQLMLGVRLFRTCCSTYLGLIANLYIKRQRNADDINS